MAEKFSGKHVFGVGVLVNGICTLLSPVAAKLDYKALMLLRIVMGLTGVSVLFVQDVYYKNLRNYFIPRKLYHCFNIHILIVFYIIWML